MYFKEVTRCDFLELYSPLSALEARKSSMITDIINTRLPHTVLLSISFDLVCEDELFYLKHLSFSIIEHFLQVGKHEDVLSRLFVAYGHRLLLTKQILSHTL
jgi:hypothetical protein